MRQKFSSLLQLAQVRRFCAWTSAAFLSTMQVACHSGPKVRTDAQDLPSLLAVVLPVSIEVDRFTRVVSFAGDGEPDGLEVVVTARDAMGDPVKAIGTFNFDLYAMQLASGDRLGHRQADWTVPLTGTDDVARYWDRFARAYRFPLRIDGRAPMRARYVLSARLVPPVGGTLFDEYEIEPPSGPAPPAR